MKSNNKNVFNDSMRLLRTLKTSGTITPSSKFLISRLLSPINFATTRCIVELGPGNGCVTRELLKRMREDSLLICFEVNSNFIADLESLNDTRLRIFNRCASSIKEVLNNLGLAKADHIVSSLPLAIIERDMRDRILSSVDSNLESGGYYTQYQYSLSNLNDVKLVFKDVKLKFTPFNIPPAFVYQCSN